MKNVERLARHITKSGAENILVYTIPGTSNWIICQKIEKDKWALTLCNPMGNVTYNLGTVTDAQHLELWSQLITMEIEKKTSQLLMANNLRKTIHHFIKHYENTYKKFIKKETNIITKEKKISPQIYKKFITGWKKENPSKTKQEGSKLSKKLKRSKKPTSKGLLRISNNP